VQGQNIQGLHDHAIAMISHPDDKLGASSGHAKANTTHDWLVNPTNKAALANINVTSPRSVFHKVPSTPYTVTQQPNLRKSDYAKLTNVKTLALLLSPTNGAISHGDRVRILSCSGSCTHEWMSIGRHSWRKVPRMPGPASQTALQFRLGVPLIILRREGGRCACNKVDFSATHSAGCKANGWAYKRHEEMVSFFVRLAKEAGLSTSCTNLANTYPKIDTTG
jgi:hypothetical protein